MWDGPCRDQRAFCFGLGFFCLLFFNSDFKDFLLSAAVLYFLLQVSFLVDEGVSPVLLQLLSCALCGSKVLSVASSSGSSSTSSTSAPAASGSGQPATQSKSSTKKSKKEEKEKEREGELQLCPVLWCFKGMGCSSQPFLFLFRENCLLLVVINTTVVKASWIVARALALIQQ